MPSAFRRAFAPTDPSEPSDIARRGLVLEVVMGSHAYGVASAGSDLDIYGVCVPPKHVVFPHLAGVVRGFGHQGESFEQFQKHHVMHEGVEHDFTIFGIVKFFSLCMECNPNMIDSLFAPDECVLFSNEVGRMIRSHRHRFLSEFARARFLGYAHSQIHKMEIKDPAPGSKREDLVRRHGYDTKFAAHAWRLLDEAEQILSTRNLDLRRCKDTLAEIRAGEWPLEDLKRRASEKFAAVKAMPTCTWLPEAPDESRIKTLLLDCLEEHYGSLQGCINREGNP